MPEASHPIPRHSPPGQPAPAGGTLLLQYRSSCSPNTAMLSCSGCPEPRISLACTNTRPETGCSEHWRRNRFAQSGLHGWVVAGRRGESPANSLSVRHAAVRVPSAPHDRGPGVSRPLPTPRAAGTAPPKPLQPGPPHPTLCAAPGVDEDPCIGDPGFPFWQELPGVTQRPVVVVQQPEPPVHHDACACRDANSARLRPLSRSWRRPAAATANQRQPT